MDNRVLYIIVRRHSLLCYQPNLIPTMHPSLRFLLVALLALLLQACAIAPVTTELPLQAGQMQVPAKEPGKTYLLLYNNASKLLHGLDNTARINVWLDGKGVGGLDIGHYVQLVLPDGDYTLKLIHRDLVEFESTHKLSLVGKPLFIEMQPTIVSNTITVHTELPSGNDLPVPFQPYRP